MAIGASTPTQTRVLKPLTQRLFSGNLSYTSSYIYKYVNDLTKFIGNNLIVNGCDLNDISFTDTDITIEINTGYLIHDRAFIDLTDGSNVTLTYTNASSFDSDGEFIVFTRFKNYQLNESHKLSIGMMYLSSSGVTFDEFDTDTDKIVLMTIGFTKDGFDNIDSVTPLESGSVTINGEVYTIHPTKDDNMILTIVDGGQLPL